MKKNILIVFIALLFISVNGKSRIPEVEWWTTFGGSGDEKGYSVQKTSDGGYIVAGYTRSSGAGNYDVYLIKTDSQGSELWSKTYGGIKSDVGASVQQTTDGGYIIAGSTNSFSADNYDVYLIKTDSQGSEIWSKTYGEIDDDYGYSVQQTSDRGYIIAGSTNSFAIKHQTKVSSAFACGDITSTIHLITRWHSLCLSSLSDVSPCLAVRVLWLNLDIRGRDGIKLKLTTPYIRKN